MAATWGRIVSIATWLSYRVRDVVEFHPKSKAVLNVALDPKGTLKEAVRLPLPNEFDQWDARVEWKGREESGASEHQAYASLI
ncbi:MAG: hypothetical protein ETSY2_09550 [Candidatus Entotheonella gemina]|uniref:Uncharacterized protein n=1 Tax=Candidatus Entotheonella gemina TaxID=1429439 RepID=W4MC10_9BACT|nr:MAG: hypothetical protein ETSY2_09550 [Candidatus Entotheonella gemina]